MVFLEALYVAGLVLHYDVCAGLRTQLCLEEEQGICIFTPYRTSLSDQIRIFKTRVQEEVSVIRQCLFQSGSNPQAQETISQTSNLPHLIGVWETFLQEKDVVAIRAKVHGESIDIISENGLKWIRVSARNPISVANEPSSSPHSADNDEEETRLPAKRPSRHSQENTDSSEGGFFNDLSSSSCSVDSPAPASAGLEEMTRLMSQNDATLDSLNKEISIIREKYPILKNLPQQLVRCCAPDIEGREASPTLESRFDESPPPGSHPLVLRAAHLVDLSLHETSIRVANQCPVVVFRFVRGLAASLAEELRQTGCLVEGAEVPDEALNPSQTDLTRLAVDLDKSAEETRSAWPAGSAGCRGAVCKAHSTAVHIARESGLVEIHPGSFESSGCVPMFVLPPPPPAVSLLLSPLSDPLHLDTTCLVALTSDFLHCRASRMVNFKASPWRVFDAHQEKEISIPGAEAMRSVLVLPGGVRRLLLMVEDAAKRFAYIVTRVSGHEEFRRVLRMFRLKDGRELNLEGVTDFSSESARLSVMSWADLLDEETDKEKVACPPGHGKFVCRCECDCGLGCDGEEPLEIVIIQSRISDRVKNVQHAPVKPGKGKKSPIQQPPIFTDVSEATFGTADHLGHSLLTANRKVAITAANNHLVFGAVLFNEKSLVGQKGERVVGFKKALRQSMVGE